MKPLTPEDLVDASKASGYKHVNSASTGKGHRTSGTTLNRFWRAETGPRSDGTRFRGPTRQEPRDAAQDWCDRVNSSFIKPLIHRFDAPDIDMGTTVHTTARTSVTIKRAEFKGPHDLYDVVLYDAVTGQVFRRKVGITARGEKRYADIAATFGFSIKPFGKAVTYPTKEAARSAESLKIAEVQKDPEWRQVGKECFALAVTEGNR